MKIAVKKIRCPTCQKLVMCREEKVNDTIRITCAECKNTIWVKENLSWHHIKSAE